LLGEAIFTRAIMNYSDEEIDKAASSGDTVVLRIDENAAARAWYFSTPFAKSFVNAIAACRAAMCSNHPAVIRWI
jgi:hypothetical protein